MTTEREAMTEKICPQTRSKQFPTGLNCAGSICMHWRWHPVLDALHKGADRTGCCGTAGKP